MSPESEGRRDGKGNRLMSLKISKVRYEKLKAAAEKAKLDPRAFLQGFISDALDKLPEPKED